MYKHLVTDHRQWLQLQSVNELSVLHFHETHVKTVMLLTESKIYPLIIIIHTEL